jgi:hypothetical protein
VARDDLSSDIRQFAITLYSVTETKDVLVQAVIRGGRDIEGRFTSEE